MARLLLAFALLAASPAVLAQGAGAPHNEGVRVLAPEDAYVEAEVALDEAALRRIVDDRFVMSNGDATTSDKDALIATVLGFGMTGQTITERSVVVDGPMAVVTGTAGHRFATDAGGDRVETLRYASVYVDRAGAWRPLALHMSPRATADGGVGR